MAVDAPSGSGLWLVWGMMYLHKEMEINSLFDLNI